jgi:MtN3 and saliva related transmembrane protein
MGCVAGVLTSVAYVPQITKLLKTKQAAGISIPMFMCSFFGCLIWFIYGVIIQSVALIIFNILNVSTTLIIMVLTKRFSK